MMSAGIGFVITYTAEAGYEFGEAFTYVDSTYAENGISQEETRNGADIPTATVFPVYTLSFDKSALDYRHISTVAVKGTNGVRDRVGREEGRVRGRSGAGDGNMAQAVRVRPLAWGDS